MFWKASVAVEGDVGTFLKDLSSAVASRSYKVDKDWVQKLAARDEEKEQANAKVSSL